MSLARLLQLASPALPVGAYSYSQGLESAIEAGIVKDARSARDWIADVLELSVARLEAPFLGKFLASPSQALNDFFVATRETAELRAETLQMGHSLARLLSDLDVEMPIHEPSYPAAYACAARAWGIGAREATLAYLWSWLENQVLAAVKAVPLGQTDAQKMLLELGGRLEEIVDRELGEENWANFTPGLAVLSSRHEVQYSRLFRS